MGSGGPAGAGGSAGGGANPGPAGPSAHVTGTVMRRLNSFEYDNTVRELLGETGRPSSNFPPDERHGSFDNDAASLGFSSVFAEQVLTVSEGLARNLVAKNLSKFAPCAATATTEACAREFITNFGARAWRRPLETAEIDRILAVHRLGAMQQGFPRGLEMAASTIMVSLPFLYRIEVGDGKPVAGKPGLVGLTSYEMASRLSYLIWGGPPDDQLMAAAKADTLKQPADITRQVERMLGAKGDPRARAVAAHFHNAWLGLDKVITATKDPMMFMGYTDAFPALLQQELDGFLDAAAWDGAGLKDILTAPYSFMNRTLATYYGATGATADSFVRVQLDPQRRAGLLTSGSFLAMMASHDRTSVVHRGVFVRQKLLCNSLPPPPGNVNVNLAPITSNLTNREIVLKHSSDPACWGCHQLIDPIGVGFEKYDASGRYREMESGKIIDDSGEVSNTPIGKFKGAVELATKLAGVDDTARCFARMWLRYALGRDVTPADDPDIARIVAAGGNYRATLLAVTQLDSFMYRPGGSP